MIRATLFLLVAWPITAAYGQAATPLPSAPADYVLDESGALSSEQSSVLLNGLRQFERETSHQMVVAVFPKVPDDYVMEDFTRRVAEEWGVGGKDRDNGMVLFVFPESRKLRVEVGCGLEGAVPDTLVNRIINEEIIPSFRVGDLGGGIVKGADALMAAARDGQQNPPVWVTLPDPLIINGQKHYAVQYESHDAINLHITSSTKLGDGLGEPRIIPIKHLPTDLQRKFDYNQELIEAIPATLTVNGQTYKSVAYQSHDAINLQIVMENGAAQIPIKHLPTDLQRKLGYSWEKEVATLAALDAAYKEKQRVAHEAEQDRKQRVEAAQRAEAEAEQMAHGSKPIIIDLRGLASAMGRQDGKFLAPSIEPALKERLIDPSSLQWGKLVSSEKATLNGEKCYKVVLTFSAANRFGGLTPGTATAYVRDGTLLELEVSNESTSGTGGWRPL